MKELQALSKAIERLQSDQGAQAEEKMTAFEGLLSEISTALSDLVSVIEDRPSDMGALVEAIRSIRVDIPPPEAPKVEVHPPQVNVENRIEVNPTPVQVTAQMPNQPAPVVNFNQNDWSSMKVTVGVSGTGAKEYTISKVRK